MTLISKDIWSASNMWLEVCKLFERWRHSESSYVLFKWRLHLHFWWRNLASCGSKIILKSSPGGSKIEPGSLKIKPLELQNWLFRTISPDITFSSSNVTPLFGVLTSIKSIGKKILPATNIYIQNHSRKWTQIKIWMYEPHSNFDFKSLALPICRRPRFSKFP